jgi:hypothetical protein
VILVTCGENKKKSIFSERQTVGSAVKREKVKHGSECAGSVSAQMRDEFSLLRIVQTVMAAQRHSRRSRTIARRSWKKK